MDWLKSKWNEFVFSVQGGLLSLVGVIAAVVAVVASYWASKFVTGKKWYRYALSFVAFVFLFPFLLVFGMQLQNKPSTVTTGNTGAGSTVLL